MKSICFSFSILLLAIVILEQSIAFYYHHQSHHFHKRHKISSHKPSEERLRILALAEASADFNALNPMNAPGMRKAMEKVKRMQDERNLQIQKLGRRKSKQQMEPPVRAFVKTVSSCLLPLLFYNYPSVCSTH
jgi:hypothetical protein